MSDRTSIPWCDSTWNPLIGCRKLSPGCANCFAAGLNERFRWTTWGGPPRRAAVATFDAPLHWVKKPWACDCGCFEDDDVDEELGVCQGCMRAPHRRRVFLGSMMDLFYEQNRIEDVADILDIIRRTPHLDYLVLTKMPERWSDTMRRVLVQWSYGDRPSEQWKWLHDWANNGHPPTNIWLGVSVENQRLADRRIPELLRVPAKVHFLSCEPLLEDIDLEAPTYLVGKLPSWVIVCGESGKNHRLCDPQWIAGIVEQCQAAGVPVFVKQDSHRLPGQQGRIPEQLWRLNDFPGVAR